MAHPEGLLLSDALHLQKLQSLIFHAVASLPVKDRTIVEPVRFAHNGSLPTE